MTNGFYLEIAKAIGDDFVRKCLLAFYVDWKSMSDRRTYRQWLLSEDFKSYDAIAKRYIKKFKIISSDRLDSTF